MIVPIPFFRHSLSLRAFAANKKINCFFALQNAEDCVTSYFRKEEDNKRMGL